MIQRPTPDQFIRVEAAFHDALERPEADRSAFLDAEFSGEPHLLAMVRRMLRAHASESVMLDSAVLAAPSDGRPAEGDDVAVGALIGPWRIERKLASGGMSTVYLACRESGGYLQRVAVKRIAVGADAGRFAIERRILAELDHPGIARLIDGGSGADGRLWLATEFVEGEQIDRFCEARGLDIRARVELLIQVAEAVAYAHARLIVHRDIKPSNILVTDEGRVRLVDFGIAKALDPDAAAATQTGTFVMTPRHAAPEQILGEAVTVQTDVYALGVLACELLAGCHPVARPGDALVKLARAIVDGDARPPSVLCDDRQRARQLQGDLDAIVLKALQKRPADRYPSMTRMADDLRNHLSGEVVTARRESRGYRWRSAFLRHRRLVAALSVGIGVVVLALSMRLHQLAVERDQANAVAGFLGGLFTDIDPGVRNTADAGTLTVSDVLEAGRDRLAGSELPVGVKARLWLQLAQGFNGIEAWGDAAGAAGEALALAETAERVPAFAVQARWTLAVATAGQRKYDEAEHLFSALQAQDIADVHLRGLIERDHAAALIDAGRLDAALHLLDRAQSSLASSNDAVAESATLRFRATTLSRLGRDDEALTAARAALELAIEHFAGDEIQRGLCEANFASIMRDVDPAGAEPYFLQAIARFKRVLGADHVNTVNAENNYAILLWRMHRFDEAEPLMRANVLHHRRASGADSRASGEALQNLAALLYERGDYDESIRVAQRASAALDASLPPRHYFRALPLLTIGGAQLAKGNAIDATAALEKAEALLAESLPPSALPVQIARARQAMALAAMRRCAEAGPRLERAYQALDEDARKRYGPEFERARSSCEASVSR